MKNKILEDVLVYITSPILIFALVDPTKIKYFTIGLGFIITFYTILGKKKNGKINFTGVIFSIVYITFSLFKESIQPGFNRYIIDTYFLIICTISIIIFNLLEKSVVKQIYRDCLRLNGWSILKIWNFIKKSNVCYYLKKMESIVTVNLLTLVLIKVYSIATYGSKSYKTTTDLEILVCVLFVIGEIYILSKILSLSKKDGVVEKKSIIDNNKYNKRIINLNQYKNMNK